MKMNDLKHNLLIAMPTQEDKTFKKSVIYIDSHDDSGAVGLMINKPLTTNLGKILEHLDINITNPDIASIPVFSGGPLGNEKGFIISCPTPPEKNGTQGSILVSTAKKSLEHIAANQGPDRFLITLGYTGWSSGQLEQEIQRNDWLITPCDPSILFETPVPLRWEEAPKLIGIDIHQLSSHIGHA